MGKLSANWRFLLMSQIVKGKFFLRPDMAISLGSHLGRIMAGEDDSAEEVADREICIVCIDESGKEKLFFYGEDPNRSSDGSIYDDAPKGSVALIPVKGTMLKYGTMCEYGTMELAGFIKEAAAHKNISAIVLDHDSGGGAVDAVAPMLQAIEFVKAQGKPIVASIDMACSAAYWTASACDVMIADNGISAEVGSIGVMMSFMDVRGYYEEMGVKFHSIYSSESDQKNLPFEQALKGEYDLIRQEQLDPLARNFQEAMRANRAGKLNLDAKGILNGKTYFAQDALENGLIDMIGTREKAIQVAIGRAHASKLLT